MNHYSYIITNRWADSIYLHTNFNTESLWCDMYAYSRHVALHTNTLHPVVL